MKRRNPKLIVYEMGSPAPGVPADVPFAYCDDDFSDDRGIITRNFLNIEFRLSKELKRFEKIDMGGYLYGSYIVGGFTMEETFGDVVLEIGSCSPYP